MLRFLANNPVREGRFIRVDIDPHGQPSCCATPTVDR
jgi:hypothetical protein